MLLKNTHSFVVIAVLTSSLASCHLTPIQSSQSPSVTDIAMNIPVTIEDTKVDDDRVIQWANGYNWQLQQVVDAQDNTINISTVPSVTIEVAPSNIKLTQGCQRYDIEILSILSPPFPNYGSGKLAAESLCTDNLVDKTVKSDTNNYNQKVDYNIIERLLPQHPYSSLNFNLKLLPLDVTQVQTRILTNVAPRRLAFNIENGASLIFVGNFKDLPKPTGLLISNELLERYQWRLVSAVSNDYDNNGTLVSRNPISDFYYPDFPILLSFSDGRDQYASFYANCNYGIGGPYALLKDNTLLIGYGPQSVMGCGYQGNKAEATLSGMMARSKSKLSLSLQPPYQIENQIDFPRYNLLQTMETGETLVWQNTIKVSR